VPPLNFFYVFLFYLEACVDDDLAF